MKYKLLKLLAVAATLTSVAAHAQTYDIDITMTGIQSAPTTFLGSFTFNSGATGACSAAFCAPGLTPEFTNVKIGDPISGGAFTDVVAGQSSLSFYDTYFGVAGQSSFVHTLSFSLNSLLTSGQSTIGISNVVFATTENVTGIYACNAGQSSSVGNVACTTTTLSLAPKAAAAPEMDPASAVAGLAILFGGIAVLRGQRRRG
jgi:hypothetical protein